jgi:hypothetical protein
MALQIRRGLESARTSFTPIQGEILYVTDTKRVYIGDGTTVGGTQVGGDLLFPIIDNIKLGYATTATAGGTTTLTATSGRQQLFTGSANQTIVLPVTSTLALGVSYEIENLSTGTLTVQSSGTNTIGTIPPGVTGHLLCISTSLTTAAAWDLDYNAFSTLTGTGNNVLATSPTISGLTLTGTLTAGGGVGTSGQYLQSTGTGVQWAAAGGSVVAGTGISVSGSTVSLATSGASAGTYGNNYSNGIYIYMPQLTVDSYGRVTSVSHNYIQLGGGGSTPNGISNIYVNGSPASFSIGQNDTLNFAGTGATTVSASYGTYKTITINSTASSGGGGSLTWQTTTTGYNQGPTTITYDSTHATSGNRTYVAFFGSGMSSSWINVYPSGWNFGSGMNWYVYYFNGYSGAPTSNSWGFSNMGHMIYTTWTVAGATSGMVSGSSTSGSAMIYVSPPPSDTKTYTVLFGSTNLSLNMTTATITAPSGFSSAGSKQHPLDSGLTVIAYQNPTPTSGSQNFSISNPGMYMYYYTYASAY